MHGYTNCDAIYATVVSCTIGGHWLTRVSICMVTCQHDSCETERCVAFYTELLFIPPIHVGNAGECIHPGRLSRGDKALILLL